MAKMKLDKRSLAVQHAASRDPLRYILHCVKVTPEWVVATDGRILIRVKNGAAQPDDAKGEVLLSKCAVGFVKKMFGNAKSSHPVTLEVGEDKKLRAEGFAADGSIKLEAPHPEGKFPEYEKVVPKDTEHRFTINVGILEKAVKAAKAAGVEGLSFFQKKDNKRSALELRGSGMLDGVEEISIIVMPMRY